MVATGSNTSAGWATSGLEAMRYLLDSVILIDHFNGIADATEFLASEPLECAISVITRAEALAGFSPDSEALARELLDSYVAFPVTVQVADTAARLRRTERWKLRDALQAAIALEQDLTLVTRNTKEFKDHAPVRMATAYLIL